jgi:hypothetical protein
MTTRSFPFAVALLLVCHGGALAQQWPGSALALRTSGGALRSGDCVRLTLVAAEDVPGPITPTVSYAFDQAVTVEDEDGNTQTSIRRAVVERPASPTFDRLQAGSSVVLDDAFCFGQNSRPGAYDIAVKLAASGVPVASLSTCVGFYTDDEKPPAGCGFSLRGALRRDGNDTVVFDTRGGATGLPRLLVFRGDALLRVVEHGIAASGPGELSVPGVAFEGLGTAPVDVVLQDQAGSRSASAARLIIPR